MAWRNLTSTLPLPSTILNAGKITGADKKFLEAAVVSSFNTVHDTSVIELESFKLSTFEPGSVLSSILPGYLGGTYSYGGGRGRYCGTRCSNDDMMLGADMIMATHHKWQTELNKVLDESGSPGLSKISNVVIKIDGDESGALSVDSDDMDEFTFDAAISFDDPNALDVDDADKEIFSGCVVSSFNDAHDTSVIELESFKLSKFEPGSSKILPGYLGGTYSYGGGRGRYCGTRCSNDDMMLGADMIMATHHKWQKGLEKCLDESGSSALASSSNVHIKVGSDASGALYADSDMDEFTFNMAVSFNDPNALDADDADKEIFCDCVVSSFNDVHDASVMKLTDFHMSKWEANAGMLSLLRGSTPNNYVGGTYSYGGSRGRYCGTRCSNDDLLESADDMLKATHHKWQKGLEKCLDESGSSALASSSNVQIKIDSDSTVAAE